MSQVKLIAEPWDLGAGGYQVGNFPPLWTEWNGRYRDAVRDFWRHQPGTVGEFASRLTGSSDWTTCLDTTEPRQGRHHPLAYPPVIRAGETVTVAQHSQRLLIRVP